MPQPLSLLAEMRALEAKRARGEILPAEEQRLDELKSLVGGAPAAPRGFDINAAAAAVRESLVPPGMAPVALPAPNRNPAPPPAASALGPAPTADVPEYLADPAQSEEVSFEEVPLAEAGAAEPTEGMPFDAARAFGLPPEQPAAAEAQQWDPSQAGGWDAGAGSEGYDPANYAHQWSVPETAGDPNAQAAAEPELWDPNAPPYDPGVQAWDPGAAPVEPPLDPGLDPNAQPWDPNAPSLDPNFDPNAQAWAAETAPSDPGLDPSAQPWDPNALPLDPGLDPNAQPWEASAAPADPGLDPNAQPWDPNALPQDPALDSGAQPWDASAVPADPGFDPNAQPWDPNAPPSSWEAQQAGGWDPSAAGAAAFDSGSPGAEWSAAETGHDPAAMAAQAGAQPWEPDTSAAWDPNATQPWDPQSGGSLEAVHGEPPAGDPAAPAADDGGHWELHSSASPAGDPGEDAGTASWDLGGTPGTLPELEPEPEPEVGPLPPSVVREPEMDPGRTAVWSLSAVHGGYEEFRHQLPRGWSGEEGQALLDDMRVVTSGSFAPTAPGFLPTAAAPAEPAPQQPEPEPPGGDGERAHLADVFALAEQAAATAAAAPPPDFDLPPMTEAEEAILEVGEDIREVPVDVTDAGGASAAAPAGDGDDLPAAADAPAQEPPPAVTQPEDDFPATYSETEEPTPAPRAAPPEPAPPPSPPAQAPRAPPAGTTAFPEAWGRPASPPAAPKLASPTATPPRAPPPAAPKPPPLAAPPARPPVAARPSSPPAVPPPSEPVPLDSLGSEEVEPAPAPPPPPAAPVVAPNRVAGRHRVVLHTVEGQVKRGTLVDPALDGAVLALEQPAGDPDQVPVDRVRAIFFMLGAGEAAPEPSGRKVRVTFRDGRQVAGFSPDYDPAAFGFFMIPADSRTNTARIWVYRSAVRQVSVSDS